MRVTTMTSDLDIGGEDEGRDEDNSEDRGFDEQDIC